MSRIDYSKWDHIEISDDEDDTHPNVDTASLFKWRHEARVQRRQEEEAEKKRKDAERKARELMIQKLKERREELKADSGDAAQAQLKGIEEKLEELTVQQKDFLEKEAELERMQREHPKWDVDNISKDKESRTIINSYQAPEPEPKTEDDQLDTMNDFFKRYKAEAIAYAHLTDIKQSQKYLGEHPELLCDHLASFLSIYCVDCQVDDDAKLVAGVARQTVMIQYILELAKSMKRDPRDCFNAFFARMATAQDEYKAAFEDEVKGLIERVKDRAQARFDEAKKRRAEEEAAEREARLGPGGLDPLEVLETLPPAIKEAFEKQDTPALQAGFAALSKEDAEYHFKRVVDSGLWVPGGGDAEEEADDEAK
eukprot:TRINITY_DN9662_c0_g1_i1.p1 TRINITY_DN9662_c0_g1~~TRINITY_DN9662_c0_g1_i1.p1  ORF type:complete len:379 (+),score=129.77 TRINITY_DN9662_c0_g1_i1:34-1137(+)